MKHTGWPPGLLQDDSRPLSRWLAGRINARQQARIAAREAAREASLERQVDTPLPDWRFWVTLAPFLSPWVWLLVWLWR